MTYFDSFLRLVLPEATRPDSALHGVEHWRRVAANGAELAAKTVGADTTVVAAFAALHDSQRHNEDDDPEHGARAAELAKRLDLGLTASQQETLIAALVDHDRGGISSDPTIGCCWDADRQDLARLWIEPLPELLSTPAARAWAAARLTRWQAVG